MVAIIALTALGSWFSSPHETNGGPSSKIISRSALDVCLPTTITHTHTPCASGYCLAPTPAPTSLVRRKCPPYSYATVYKEKYHYEKASHTLTVYETIREDHHIIADLTTTKFVTLLDAYSVDIYHTESFTEFISFEFVSFIPVPTTTTAVETFLAEIFGFTTTETARYTTTEQHTVTQVMESVETTTETTTKYVPITTSSTPESALTASMKFTWAGDSALTKEVIKTIYTTVKVRGSDRVTDHVRTPKTFMTKHAFE
jgi:hypothetical protein